MKALIFHIGRDRYGLRLGAVRRVLPLLTLKALPLAPPAVAGLMDFHGQPVPVIDLCRLAGAAAAPACYDTRIVLVDYHTADGACHLLGLVAEGVRGVHEIDAAALADSGVAGAPFLGQVAGTGDGMLQLLEPAQMLTPALRALLFQSPGEAA